MDSKRKEDILLVGAGLTGLTFCNFLKNSKLKITILDSNPDKFYKELDNTRYIVLSNTSKKILSKLDLWKDRLPIREDFPSTGYCLFYEMNFISIMYGLKLLNKKALSKIYDGFSDYHKLKIKKL